MTHVPSDRSATMESDPWLAARYPSVCIDLTRTLSRVALLWAGAWIACRLASKPAEAMTSVVTVMVAAFISISLIGQISFVLRRCVAVSTYGAWVIRLVNCIELLLILQSARWAD
jgi:hypothetical protein